MVQDPKHWIRSGFVLKPDTEQTDGEAFGGEDGCSSLRCLGRGKVASDAEICRRDRKTPRGSQWIVCAMLALPSPGRGKLRLTVRG